MKTISEHGRCEKEFNNIKVFYEVVGNTVVRVSCKHELCKWKKSCALYQKHPIGSVVN